MQEESWLWIGKYVIVIVAALVLGAVLGSLDPFRDATIGGAHISAGMLVQFIAHSGALALLWALGFRHAAQLRRGAGGSSHLAGCALAFVTLVVAASFYGVLLHLLTPLLEAGEKPYLDWGFIAAILGAAGWLLWSLFANSEAFIAALAVAAARRNKAAESAGG